MELEETITGGMGMDRRQGDGEEKEEESNQLQRAVIEYTHNSTKQFNRLNPITINKVCSIISYQLI